MLLSLYCLFIYLNDLFDSFLWFYCCFVYLLLYLLNIIMYCTCNYTILYIKVKYCPLTDLHSHKVYNYKLKFGMLVSHNMIKGCTKLGLDKLFNFFFYISNFIQIGLLKWTWMRFSLKPLLITETHTYSYFMLGGSKCTVSMQLLSFG